MDIISLFAGAGGLDFGFQQAGWRIAWANEYDRHIWQTYEYNHPHTLLDRRSITAIADAEIPAAMGLIGGPPCQSWSAAGALRGIHDQRGQLFFEFIRILRAKQPLFFLAENVAGMLLPRHHTALQNIKSLFADSGYHLAFKRLNAADYGVPQERERVFFIGYRHDLNLSFHFPEPSTAARDNTLKHAIADLQNNALPALSHQYSNGDCCAVPNHEYLTGGFSSIYLSRNRVRAWDELSFTIQASGRHAPLHPQAPKMELIAPDVRRFVPGSEQLYRRLSVRECARIQTFPDTFIFHYQNLAAGYKMVGNAVPPLLAYHLACAILAQLKPYLTAHANSPISVLNTGVADVSAIHSNH
ncbi:DNA (cytosine-5-)-methyltransferase [Chromatium okenii]|uniref:DNA cytosine methyltransferase n=1 Tax=Chromatium okenii TaxID=61644 RepID=UPI001905D513|nr:DNA cytosine methyltransferase [Chromatium okenii]MBK1641044.1 DNA (cytosine-5-)-methyltransferase [Chromatium okenii]